MVHALIARHYQYGGFYPIGGASAIAKSIIPVIQAGGGDVLTYADVVEILVRKGRAAGVRMADGHEIRAPLVISNAGVINTFERLLPAADSRDPGYPDKRRRIEPSMCNIVLYTGLRRTQVNHELPLTNRSTYL